MEKTTTVAGLNYQEDNYSKIFAHSATQLNMSTVMSAKSHFLGDIEFNEFVRRWFEFSIMMILILIGTFGNVHTILVYLRVKDMKERFHVRTLIIWLSAVDLTTCVVVMPFETYDFRWRYSISSNAACKLFRYIVFTTVMSSWLILTVIAYERYKTICGMWLGTKSVIPINICRVNSWVKGKSTFCQNNLVCFLIVIFTLVVSSPTLVIVGIEPVPLKNRTIFGTECRTHNQYRSKRTAGLYSVGVGLCGFLCLMCCSYCYGKILCFLYKQYKKEKKRRENIILLSAKVHKAQQSSCNRHRKPKCRVTISLIAATGFSLCGVIISSIGAAIDVSDSALKQSIITDVMKRGYFLNNVCNPVIYFIWDNKFRHACRKLYIK